MNSNTSTNRTFENFTNSTQMNSFWPLLGQEENQMIYAGNQWKEQVSHAIEKQKASFTGNNFQPWSEMNSCMLREYLILMQQQKLIQEQLWLSKQQELQRQALQSVACNIQYPTYSQYYKDENSNDISNSLRKFSAFTALENDNGYQFSKNSNNNIDAIMEEFAVNGCTKDAEPHETKTNFETAYNSFEKLNAIVERKKMNSLDDLQWQPYLESQQIPNNIFPPLNQKTQSKRNHSYKKQKKVASYCVFCENNNEPAPVVKSHSVRDSLGRVLCPKLRIYVCPICKASGDEAHTVKYCPKKPIITMEIAEKQKFIT